MKSRSPFRIALVGATFLLLAACGNKGPLVMPQKPVPVEAQPVADPQQAPAPQNEPADEAQPVDGTQNPLDDGR